jgi:hypothetical protein
MLSWFLVTMNDGRDCWKTHDGWWSTVDDGGQLWWSR